MRLQKIVSGGQTGVDRAALDVALELQIPCGGWCPRGRRAEDGTISGCYPLQETRGRQYAVRTRLNVRDSDGTLILTAGPPTGGTKLTAEFCRSLDRPCLIVDLDDDTTTGNDRLQAVTDWLEECDIATLNVAGPRESTSPGMYVEAFAFLAALVNRLRAGG